MSSDVRNSLLALKNDVRADFVAGLVPGFPRENILGVTAKETDALAKKLVSSGEHLTFLEEKHRYLEEFSIHGAILGFARFPLEILLTEIDRFLPQIDNWSVCDGTVARLKIIKKHPKIFHEKCVEYLQSDQPFTVRFAIVTLLDHFLDEHFDPDDLTRLAAVNTDEFYVNMALAWYFSFALIKQYDQTLSLFENRRIVNPWVHDKAIQKARESYRISPERKEYLKSLKLRENKK